MDVVDNVDGKVHRTPNSNIFPKLNNSQQYKQIVWPEQQTVRKTQCFILNKNYERSILTPDFLKIPNVDHLFDRP